MLQSQLGVGGLGSHFYWLLSEEVQDGFVGPWAGVLMGLAVDEVLQSGVASNSEFSAGVFVECAVDFGYFDWVKHALPSLSSDSSIAFANSV